MFAPKMSFLFVVLMCFNAVFAGIVADSDTSSAARQKRASLGLSVDHAYCQHLGKSCGVTRDSRDNPTKVVLIPCCKHLQCVGVSPNVNAVPSSLPELIASKLGNSSPDYTVYTGMCSLGLDNNAAYTDFDAYKDYVKSLDKID